MFCDIARGRAPAHREHLLDGSGELISYPDVVAFHNRLDWARVMLLVVPVEHMTQAELWTGPVLEQAASFAVRLGEKLVPEGFRLLSNFGRPAHQSQEHAHIHLVATPDSSLPLTFHGKEPRVASDEGGVRITGIRVPGVAWSVRVTTFDAASQRSMWLGEKLLHCGWAAVNLASRETPDGFRLISNFVSPATGVEGGGEPGLLVLGGGQLDLYA